MSQATALGISTPAMLWLALRELPAQILAVLEGKNERHRVQRDAVTAFSVRCASAALLYHNLAARDVQTLVLLGDPVVTLVAADG